MSGDVSGEPENKNVWWRSQERLVGRGLDNQNELVVRDDRMMRGTLAEEFWLYGLLTWFSVRDCGRMNRVACR